MHIVFIYIFLFVCLFLSKSKVYLFCEMTIGVFCFWWFLHHRIRVALKQPCLLARQSWKSLLFDVSSIQSLLDTWVYTGKEALIPFWLLYFTQSTVAFGKVWNSWLGKMRKSRKRRGIFENWSHYNKSPCIFLMLQICPLYFWNYRNTFISLNKVLSFQKPP